MARTLSRAREAPGSRSGAPGIRSPYGAENRLQGLGRAVRTRASCSSIAVRAEEDGLDSRHGQRPLPAVAPRRRARAVLAVLAGRRRRADQPGPARHLGDDADVPLQPGGGRAGVRDARLRSTRAASCSASAPARRSTRSRRVGRAHGEQGVAGVQGAVRPAARVGHADAQALDRGAGDLRGRVLRRPRTPPSTTGRTTPIPVYVAAGGPLVARYAGRVRRRVHLHLGQGRGALRRQAAAGRRRGRGEGRPHPRRHRPDDRDQAVLRPRPRPGAREHPVLGAAGALRRAEARHQRPDRDGAGSATRCRSSRSRRAGSSRPTRTRSSRRSSSTSTGASTTSSSTGRVTTSRGSSRRSREQVLPGLRALG